MSDKGKWVTVNGTHIFIKDGQTIDDALKGMSIDELKEVSTCDTSEGRNTTELETLLGKEYKGVKGQDAINLLLKEKQGHVKAAFHRDDIGDIDLLWGNDKLGLQHIILHREQQGIDGVKFVSEIADVITEGKYVKTNARGNFEYWYKGRMAVIAPEYHNEKMTYLLTAFKKTKAPK